MTDTQTADTAQVDPRAEALSKLERPGIKWKVLLQVAAAFAILWLTALMVQPYVGYWGVGIVGVLTLAAAGFGLYIWRLTRKSAAIVDILKQATDAEGRRTALEALGSRKDSHDAINALARSQLLAQEDPGAAVRVLEEIDLAKAPAVVQDDVRANLTLMYLLQNRTREARELSAEIRLDRQPQAKSKALYAAVIAESQARTGDAQEAKKLLETYDARDAAYAEVRAMLLRAQVYTFSATKNRGLARKALEELMSADPNMVTAFMKKGGAPVEVQKMARQMLSQAHVLPKAKYRTH